MADDIKDFPAFSVMTMSPPVADGAKTYWDGVFEKLLAIRTYQDDWDGMDALAPSLEIVDSAIKLADLLNRNEWPAPARVSATPSGTVILEWQEPEYLEFEICEPYKLAWMRVDLGGHTTHGVMGVGDLA